MPHPGQSWPQCPGRRGLACFRVRFASFHIRRYRIWRAARIPPGRMRWVRWLGGCSTGAPDRETKRAATPLPGCFPLRWRVLAGAPAGAVGVVERRALHRGSRGSNGADKQGRQDISCASTRYPSRSAGWREREEVEDARDSACHKDMVEWRVHNTAHKANAVRGGSSRTGARASMGGGRGD
jgi:hypothetical protein